MSSKQQSTENKESANLIYFEQKPLKVGSPIEEAPQKTKTHVAQSFHDAIRFSVEQIAERQRVNDEYEVFERIFALISSSSDKAEEGVDRLCKAISDYIIYLVKFQKEEMFFTRAVENKFIALLLSKMEEYKFVGEIVKIVFSSLEYLLRAITNDEQYVYFVMSINKEGYLTANYHFDDDDKPYFVNFLKLLARKINDDPKYLNIFYNLKQPHFPLLINLLRFHDEKDQILRTSVELTLIEISSNPSKSIQKYISNFPFVIFYPIYVYRIYNAFNHAVSENQSVSQQGKETLKTSLKFMEDFIQNKDRQAVQMYANCFMTLLGRYFYKELAELSSKTEHKVTRILKIFYEIVVRDISVVKIQMGWRQMLSKKMGKHLNKFLKSKTHHMQFTYWIADSCKEDIHEHCSSIFPGQQNKKWPKSSFIKTFNSYIPRTKDNWLFHEVKKVSELIGLEIELNREINSEEYYQGSYLEAIELDLKGDETENEVYEKLLKHDSEQNLFYYIKLATQLKVPLKTHVANKHQSCQPLIQLLNTVSKATSLSVVRSFYHLILDTELYINETKHVKVKALYEHLLEKLIYSVLTEGWNSFCNRTKIDVSTHNHHEFIPDIFRDLECDILFFVALRHLLGTKNIDGIKDDQEFASKDVRRVETKANCLLLRQREDNTLIEEPIEIVLDGQYIKLLDQELKSITHENILINRCFIHESQGSNTFEIVQKQNLEHPQQQYYMVEFLETPIKQYIWKQIKFRKEITMDLELKLRLMRFQFVMG